MTGAALQCGRLQLRMVKRAVTSMAFDRFAQLYPRLQLVLPCAILVAAQRTATLA
jgi:hypothetical protein